MECFVAPLIRLRVDVDVASAISSKTTCRHVGRRSQPEVMRWMKSLEERLQNVSFGYERSEEASSSVYDDCKTCPKARRVRWVCEKGHVVNAIEGSQCCKVCPHCMVNDFPLLRREQRSRKNLSLQAFQLIAEERGGKCLSTTYENIKKPLRWRCEKGHEWEATAENVRRGAWCARCKQEEKKLTVEDMRKTAKAFGGECLSETYVNSKEKLRWRCAKGHVFEMAPNNIRRFSGSRKPSWCKECQKAHSRASVDGKAHSELNLRIPTKCKHLTT